MTTRRELLFACAALALAVPVSAPAQKPGKVWRIGFLMEREPASFAANLDAFRQGMRELGYIEGRDFVIEQRAVSNKTSLLPALAAELIALKVDLIISTGSPSAMAARDATREIPILITTAGDPVGSGLAVSLRRPGGNVTGLTGLDTELASKRLDLLQQIVPGLRRVGYFYDADNAGNMLSYKQLQSDCASLGYTLIAAPVTKREDFAAAFSVLQRDKVQGLIVANPSWFFGSRVSIIAEAAKHRLPTVYSGGRGWSE